MEFHKAVKPLLIEMPCLAIYHFHVDETSSSSLEYCKFERQHRQGAGAGPGPGPGVRALQRPAVRFSPATEQREPIQLPPMHLSPL